MEASNFRILDLPLELQRLILSHYFDQKWTVTLYWTSKGTLAFRYVFDISLNILMSCRHFFLEGTQVLQQTRGGMYTLPGQPGASRLDFTPVEPTFWDAGIVSISISNWTWLCKETQLALKARFPQFCCISIDYDFDRVRHFASLVKQWGYSLSAVLDGDNDTILSADAEEVHRSTVLETDNNLYLAPTVLPHIKQRFAFALGIVDVKMSNSMRFYLGRQRLVLGFEINKSGCKLISKCFEPTHKWVTRRVTVEQVVTRMREE